MTAAAIRAAGPTDYDGIAALLRAAFGRDDEAALVGALREEGAVAIELVAGEGDTVVGHVMFTRATVGAAPVLALAPLAVAGAARRRGIGAALVHAGLTHCRELGEAAVLVLGDPGYYRRFGFESAAAARVTGVPWAGRPAFQALALSSAGAALSGPARYACAFGVTRQDTASTNGPRP